MACQTYPFRLAVRPGLGEDVFSIEKRNRPSAGQSRLFSPVGSNTPQRASTILLANLTRPFHVFHRRLAVHHSTYPN